MKNSMLLCLLALIGFVGPRHLFAQEMLIHNESSTNDLFTDSNSSFVQENITNRKNWGDQGNGTYINPILAADYSDPDVIREGDDFYMVCSEFHFMGMPVLHSKDLVNWTIIGRIYDRLEFESGFDTNERYGDGSWAPSIRFHDNKFWVYFCTPHGGLYMTTATNPQGSWEPLTQVVKISGWEDPCPFWDKDGQAYLGHSKLGAGPIIIHKMSADGKSLLDDGALVYTGPVAEGTKIYQLNGYYYMSIPEGGVSTGWQTILRSKSIYGPFEKKIILEQGSTAINGPHQGALVDTPNGEWWFLHFQSVASLGRVVHLQPVRWENNWPVVGVDIDRNGIGEPVYVWKKPVVNAKITIKKPQTSDDFDSSELGLQWAWNHNPVDAAWSLKKYSGKLSLEALHASGIVLAKNTLTQKIMGSSGIAAVFLNGKYMQDGQKAGLCLMGNAYALVGLEKKDGKWYLFTDINGTVRENIVSSGKVFLKVNIFTEKNQNQFFYSTNNKKFLPIGKKFQVLEGNWKGPKIGLYSFNELNDGGDAVFDLFQYEFQ